MPRIAHRIRLILDLCCGAGGFSIGFVDPGNVIVGIDISLVPLLTYHDNIRNGNPVQADICHLPIRESARFYAIVGGPPCPPFSGANIRGNRDMDSRLVDEFLRIKNFFRPVYWVMEESPFASYLVDMPRFLCANDFGLYQERRRLFAGNYPEVRLGRHCRRIHPAIRAQEVKAFNRNMKHSKKAMSCCQWFGRRLTSWELQVLMGFPGWYKFRGNYNERCVQIGNAVVPKIAREIWNAMKSGRSRHVVHGTL